MTESVPTKEAVSIGTTPRMQSSWRTLVSEAEIAKMAAFGRYLEMRRAVWPVSVKAIMSLQPESTETLTAEEQTLSTAWIWWDIASTPNRIWR
mmetsp:Transcript_55642/g.130246  ORF Transcript_55642/g.130246 Transcript_55642/m.130246 type:complete len:93 (-) Transcript_55642:514-792(-)